MSADTLGGLSFTLRRRHRPQIIRFRLHPDRFDAVLTDERMPGMSGATLIREVRGIRRAIPILLVSGYLGKGVVSRAYNAGADEVLKKPLSPRELATSLARVLHA
jgi:CheY-like chemotaxis protein